MAAASPVSPSSTPPLALLPRLRCQAELSSVPRRLPDVDVADGRADAADAAGDVAGGDTGGRTRRTRRGTLLRLLVAEKMLSLPIAMIAEYLQLQMVFQVILLSTDRWAQKDVNPALFSRELMRNSSSFLKDEEVNGDPQILLMKAHAATSSIGSATVIIAVLEKTGTLKIASVGDCGLKVIRKGQVMFSICPQEHYFDCPYQISSEAAGQTYQDALVCSVNLMDGDMIVSGSDGLFDNIFDQEIISIISESSGVNEAAKALAELARKHSVDVTFDSPYSMEAQSRGFDVPWWKKLLGAKLIGGKMDDITVVVAQVKTVAVPEDEGGDIEEQKGNEQSIAVAVASAEQNEE